MVLDVNHTITGGGSSGGGDNPIPTNEFTLTFNNNMGRTFTFVEFVNVALSTTDFGASFTPEQIVNSNYEMIVPINGTYNIRIFEVLNGEQPQLVKELKNIIIDKSKTIEVTP